MSVASEFDIQRQLITNAYNKLDDLGIDSTGIDKNIDNIAEMLDTVYEDYPKVTGTGTEVTLDGTKVGKLRLDVKGNSTQDGTPSPTNEVPILSSGDDINLFDKNNANKLDCLINNSSKVIGGYNGAKTIYIPIKGGKTYTVTKILSARLVVGSSVNTPAVNVSCSKTYQDNSATSITLETNATDNYLAVFYYLNSADTLTEQQILDSIKIAESPIVTPYSPYGMGTISEKIVNKNLADIEGNGYISATGGITEGNPYRYTRMIPIPNNITNIYFYGSNLSSSLLNVFANRICFFDENKEKLGNVTTSIATSTSYSIPTGAKYVRASYSIATENFMLAFGTATTYTAHQEQTYTIPCQQPMRKIGDVKDEFVQDEEGNWFERHNIGHYVFTGTENWGGAPSVVTGTARFYIEKSDVINDNNVQIKRIYSNRFKALTWDEIYQSDTTTINAISNYNSNTDSHRIVIRIDSTLASTKTELNTYLSNNPTYADYVLQTPVDLPCTAEQISILENLPKSYNEQTNIYSIDVTPAYLEAKALKGE